MYSSLFQYGWYSLSHYSMSSASHCVKNVTVFIVGLHHVCQCHRALTVFIIKTHSMLCVLYHPVLSSHFMKRLLRPLRLFDLHHAILLVLLQWQEIKCLGRL